MWDLKFFNSGEWDVIQERLDEMDRRGRLYNPPREKIFAALDQTEPTEVKCVLVGQDPYPRPTVATGLAFSVSRSKDPLPPTLVNILKEYHHDLHYPFPKHGDLSSWGEAGVLLWNAIPLTIDQPLSGNWVEWAFLTREVLAICDREDIPMVFLGGVARQYFPEILRSPCLCVSHPSPRGIANARTPFLGSRPFTWVNGMRKGDPVDWRIPDVFDIRDPAPTTNRAA